VRNQKRKRKRKRNRGKDIWGVKAILQKDPPFLKIWKIHQTKWKSWRILEGRPGEYIAVVRETENEEWVYATATLEPRSFELDLSFLPSDQTFVMEKHSDLPNATSLDSQFSSRKISSQDKEKISLLSTGGEVLVFAPVTLSKEK